MQIQGKDSTNIDLVHVKELRLSRVRRGERDPIKVTPDGRIVDGRHRSLAGWKSKQVVQVKDELDYWITRLDFSVQRRSSQKEHAEIFQHICQELEKTMPPDKVASYLVREVSPFERSYTYWLIPERYKGAQKIRHGEKLRSLELPKEEGQVRYEAKVYTAENPNKDRIVYPCPLCGCSGPHG